MYSPDESAGRRRNWGAVYTLLALAGVTVLTPGLTSEALTISNWLIFIWGGALVLGFGSAAVAAFSGRRFVWVENSGSWFGNVGIAIYVVSLMQTIFVDGEYTRTPATVGYLALLLILVSRSYRLQRQLKIEKRIKEIVRIAQRNDTT